MLHVGKFFVLALHGTCITQRQCHVDVQEFWKTFVPYNMWLILEKYVLEIQ